MAYTTISTPSFTLTKSIANYFNILTQVKNINLTLSANNNHQYFFMGADNSNLNITINNESLVPQTIFFYFFNMQKIKLKLALAKKQSELQIKMVLMANKCNHTLCEVTTNNNAPATKIMVDVICLGYEQSKINLICNGVIAKGMNKVTNIQALRGYNHQNSSITLAPNLLINEYDVNAAHSTVIGNKNDGALFYLMSRGLTLKEATALLQEVILKPYLSTINNNGYYEQIINHIRPFYE